MKKLKIWAVSVLILMAGLATTQAWQTSGRVVCEVNGNGQIDAVGTDKNEEWKPERNAHGSPALTL